MNSATDTELLDFLESQSAPGMYWVARESTTGRGFRLHQDVAMGQRGIPYPDEDGVGDTPRQALADYMRKRNK